MNYVNRTVDNTKIYERINNRVATRFGHRSIEGGYVCVETTLLIKPTYEKVCSIVTDYNNSHKTDYKVTQAEYDANAADVTPINVGEGNI